MIPVDCTLRCPDDGTCHHDCIRSCFRVRTCGPLSGVYPRDEWPASMRERHVEIARIDPTERGGKVGRDHPATSKRAVMNVKRGSQLSALLALLARAPDGLTCYEATAPMRDLLGRRDLARNQVATRMGELAERGLATRKVHAGRSTSVTGDRYVERCTEGENTAAVWYVTQAGLDEYRRITRAA